jgi:glutamate dehydrogenase
MLLSEKIRLVAAYDHRHVFIDPEPDAAATFAERKRLFELAGSSWDDFDRDVLSAGGGVWPRSAKRIELSEQARAALDLQDEVLTPNEVIQAILRAPVTVLWNGGIGTVVKASTETDADALDRSSDAIRVSANELRCQVVAEGGNLGLTQRARIEFARGGGHVNADFIDNSSGVDCSDHEVNLKILLDLAVRRGDLDGDGRDALLAEVTDDVAAHVLYDSFLQAQILAQEVRSSATRMFAYEDLMDELEAEGLLHRKVEFLPTSEEMADRRRGARGLERPELAVLLAYAKRSLTGALLRSSLPDDPYLDRDLRSYFPPAIVERFGELLAEHPLRRELVATIVANDVVNALGPTFVSRLVAEQGAEPADVVRAYRIARDVTSAGQRWADIERMDRGVDRHAQWQLMEGVDELMEATARWYLENALGADLEAAIAAGREGFQQILATLPGLPANAAREARESETAALVERGVPEESGRAYAYLPVLSYAPDIVAAAQTVGRTVQDVALTFWLMEDRVQIGWIQEQLDELPASTRMQRWALQALRDDLWRARRELAQRALGEAPGAAPKDAIERFVEGRPDAIRRLQSFARTLTVEGSTDLAGLTLVVRQLRALAD